MALSFSQRCIPCLSCCFVDDSKPPCFHPTYDWFVGGVAAVRNVFSGSAALTGRNLKKALMGRGVGLISGTNILLSTWLFGRTLVTSVAKLIDRTPVTLSPKLD